MFCHGKNGPPPPKGSPYFFSKISSGRSLFIEKLVPGEPPSEKNVDPQHISLAKFGPKDPPELILLQNMDSL